jgi:hypothetical protein
MTKEPKKPVRVSRLRFDDVPCKSSPSLTAEQVEIFFDSKDRQVLTSKAA